MTKEQRRSYWKSDEGKLMFGKIIQLIKNKFTIVEHKPSTQFTFQELRSRGGWGYGTSH